MIIIIIIYNKSKYQPDITIKKHNYYINFITKLSSVILISCSDHDTKLVKIKGNNYQMSQSLNYHKDDIYKIIELKNNDIVSCSQDKSVIFYFENNSKYSQLYKIHSNGICSSFTKTKENGIYYSE